MSYFRKKLERRTFSQDRYYILIKRQKAGKATFNELTELDEIVNRVPDIREKVILESFFTENTEDSGELPNHPANNEARPIIPTHPQKWWIKIKSFFHRFVLLQIHAKANTFYSFY